VVLLALYGQTPEAVEVAEAVEAVE